MEMAELHVPRAEWHDTSNGNRVAKRNRLLGLQNVSMKGKCIVFEDVMVRGDLAMMHFQKYTVLRPRAIIRPPCKHMVTPRACLVTPSYSSHIMVEEDAVVEAAALGQCVFVGRGAVLGNGCVLKDACWVEAGAVVAPDALFPAFSRIAGNPARRVGAMPFTQLDLMRDAFKAYYDNFIIDK